MTLCGLVMRTKLALISTKICRFNYVTTYADKDTDRVYLMHVTEEVQRTYIGYATPSLLENLRKVQEEKARKILVHYGHKCQELGVRSDFQLSTDFSVQIYDDEGQR